MKVAGLRTHYKDSDGKLRLSSVDWWRIDNPLTHVAKNTPHTVKFINKIVRKGHIIEDWEALGKNYDIFFSSYFSNPKPYAYLKATAKIHDAKVIMDIDDNVLDVDPMAPAYIRYHPGAKELENIKTILQDVDVLTTTTEYLANEIKKFRTKPTHVLPNYIDPYVYRYEKLVRNQKELIIGYQGSATHYSDLVDTGVLYALRRIVNDYKHVKIAFLGCLIEDFKLYIPEDRIMFLNGSTDHREWRKIWKTMPFDIGIAPLKANRFNKGKSSIKYYEYGLRAIPAVYSWFDPYLSVVKHNETGFLAKDEEEWYEILTWLVENEILRRKMGDLARKDVLENYTIQQHWQKWQNIIES